MKTNARRREEASACLVRPPSQFPSSHCSVLVLCPYPYWSFLGLFTLRDRRAASSLPVSFFSSALPAQTGREIPGIHLDVCAAAMLQQTLDGLEKEPLLNGDLERLGQRRLMALLFDMHEVTTIHTNIMIIQFYQRFKAKCNLMYLHWSIPSQVRFAMSVVCHPVSPLIPPTATSVGTHFAFS
jgi:hypothetical protein